MLNKRKTLATVPHLILSRVNILSIRKASLIVIKRTLCIETNKLRSKINPTGPANISNKMKSMPWRSTKREINSEFDLQDEVYEEKKDFVPQDRKIIICEKQPKRSIESYNFYHKICCWSWVPSNIWCWGTVLLCKWANWASI